MILARWVDDPQFLLEQVHIPDDGGVALAQGIIQGSTRAVSDGSYKPGVIGTAACIIAADAQDKDCLHAFNTVPGWEDDQSSYRSELTGIVGMWDWFGISMYGIFGKSSIYMTLTLGDRCWMSFCVM
jgi:hypothetical protein